MCVRELVDSLAPSLAVELYAAQKGEDPTHLGLFRLDTPDSLGLLLARHGEREVKQHDVYKAYVLVYIT